MYVFEVGKLYQEGIVRYEEGVKFGLGQAGADMSIFLTKPTGKEIESVKTGKLEFAFYEKDGIIFALSKIQGMNWMDMPYSVHLAQPFEFMEIPENMGFGLTIFLVDAATGILKAGRYVGLGHKFSVELKAAVLKQKQLPFIEDLYCKKIQETYKNYSAEDMVKRAIHFCRLPSQGQRT